MARLDFSVSGGGASFSFTGLDEMAEALEVLEAKAPRALASAVNEMALLGERETKLLTRVDTGRARASIGHYTPRDLTGKGPDGTDAQARAAAHHTTATPNNLSASWGTRVVYVPVLNYRLGDLMFERGLQAAIRAFPMIVSKHLEGLAS